jgi:hypothetical protein
VEGVETTYNSWDQLTILGEIGRIGTSPLIISSLNDTITMEEYMIWTLPQPEYDNPVSRPNTSGNLEKAYTCFPLVRF